MQLEGKVVAITGGARGIGKATADAFAARGARVALLDVNPSDLAAAKSDLTARGAVVATQVTNVSREEQVAQALDHVVAELGGLDVLINNAGIIRDHLLVKARDGAVVGRMSLEQWQAVVDVNLTGVFLCGREAAERMIRLQRGGLIINVTSISRAGNPGQGNYSAAKAGVEALTVVWAKELARYGIRCASIAPGFVRTDILSTMAPEMLDKVTAPVPLKRLGQPEEIAHAAVFIAENDYFTGRSLEVDGGLRF